MTKPEPVNANVVCSVCGIDWPRHRNYFTKHISVLDPSSLDAEINLEVCVALLKEDLAQAKRRAPYITGVSQLSQAS